MKPSDLEKAASRLGEMKTRYIREQRPFADIADIDKCYRDVEKALNDQRRGINFFMYGEETRYTKEKIREMNRDFDDLPPAA